MTSYESERALVYPCRPEQPAVSVGMQYGVFCGDASQVRRCRRVGIPRRYAQDAYDNVAVG